MVVVNEDIPDDADLCRVAGLNTGGDCIGGTAASASVEIHEHITLDVGVSAVNIHPVIAAAEKGIVVKLDDRPGTLGIPKVDYVVVAACRTKYT
ncbi:unnamed protein product, partial [marine sediment metagenome]